MEISGLHWSDFDHRPCFTAEDFAETIGESEKEGTESYGVSIYAQAAP